MSVIFFEALSLEKLLLPGYHPSQRRGVGLNIELERF